MELDLAFLRHWIGKTTEAEDLVTPRLLAEYHATLDPHLAEVPEGAVPLALHWCLTPPITAMAELGPDGHAAKGGFLPPIPLPRRMWAGGMIETRQPIRVGDRVVRRSKIHDIQAKQGRSGQLCFVAAQHEYSTDRGVALVEQHDIVYREARPYRAASGGGADQSRAFDLMWRLDTTPTLLFRYSAMTFNGHRIHYDQAYVTEVEGYPGLVVHGPLQATLLFNMAAKLGGGVPAIFRYRGLSPLFAGQALVVKGRRDRDGRVTCWTETDQGTVCMESECA